MSRLVLCLGIILLGAASCNKSPNDNQQAMRSDHPQGVKPVVALVPVFDHTVNDLPWSLSDELTWTIHYQLTQKDKLYLVDMQKVYAAAKKVSSKNHPFGTDLAWTKKAFAGSEFVIFLELTEHEEVPVRHGKTGSIQDSAAHLNMSVRIRVVDLRGEEPRIALQEIIHDSHHIPKQFTRVNFNQVPWGKDSFTISPLGLAHAKLSKEVTARLEDYILLAKKS